MARKKKEESIIEEKAVEVPEAVYIYHTGDDIHKIAKILTGHAYMVDRLLEYSELTFGTLKDGDILKWRV